MSGKLPLLIRRKSADNVRETAAAYQKNLLTVSGKLPLLIRNKFADNVKETAASYQKNIC